MISKSVLKLLLSAVVLGCHSGPLPSSSLHDDTQVELLTLVGTLQGHSAFTNLVVFPERQSQFPIVLDRGGKAIRWDLRTQTQIWNQDVGRGRSLDTLAYSNDARFFAAGSHSGGLRLYELATGQLLRTFVEDNYFRTVAFSPDDRFVAAKSLSDFTMHIWNAETGELLTEWRVQPMGKDIGFSADGHMLYSGAFNFIEVFNLETRQRIRQYPVPAMTTLTFSPDWRFAAYASGDTSYVINMENGETIATFQQPAGAGWAGRIAFTRNTTALQTLTGSGHVVIWDLQTSQMIKHFVAPMYVPQPYHDYCLGPHAGFTPDGNYLLTGEGSDFSVNVWRIPEWQ